MERDKVVIDGDRTIIASRKSKSVEIWTIGKDKIRTQDIDVGVCEVFNIPTIFSMTWVRNEIFPTEIQVNQMIWEGCPNID